MDLLQRAYFAAHAVNSSRIYMSGWFSRSLTHCFTHRRMPANRNSDKVVKRQTLRPLESISREQAILSAEWDRAFDGNCIRTSLTHAYVPAKPPRTFEAIRLSAVRDVSSGDWGREFRPLGFAYAFVAVLRKFASSVRCQKWIFEDESGAAIDVLVFNLQKLGYTTNAQIDGRLYLVRFVAEWVQQVPVRFHSTASQAVQIVLNAPQMICRYSGALEKLPMGYRNLAEVNTTAYRSLLSHIGQRSGYVLGTVVESAYLDPRDSRTSLFMENSLHQVVAVAFSVAPPFADSVQLVGYSLVVKDVKILVDTSERWNRKLVLLVDENAAISKNAIVPWRDMPLRPRTPLGVDVSHTLDNRVRLFHPIGRTSVGIPDGAIDSDPDRGPDGDGGTGGNPGGHDALTRVSSDDGATVHELTTGSGHAVSALPYMGLTIAGDLWRQPYVPATTQLNATAEVYNNNTRLRSDINRRGQQYEYSIAYLHRLNGALPEKLIRVALFATISEIAEKYHNVGLLHGEISPTTIVYRSGLVSGQLSKSFVDVDFWLRNGSFGVSSPSSSELSRRLNTVRQTNDAVADQFLTNHIFNDSKDAFKSTGVWVDDSAVRSGKMWQPAKGLEFASLVNHEPRVAFVHAFTDFESVMYTLMSVSIAPGLDGYGLPWCSTTSKGGRGRIRDHLASCLWCGAVTVEAGRDIANMGAKKLKHARRVAKKWLGSTAMGLLRWLHGKIIRANQRALTYLRSKNLSVSANDMPYSSELDRRQFETLQHGLMKSLKVMNSH